MNLFEKILIDFESSQFSYLIQKTIFNQNIKMTLLRITIALLTFSSFWLLGKPEPSFSKNYISEDTTKIDKEYFLEATMLGYFAKNGTRNPVLKANKGMRVRITITNGEVMTHDISMEKLGIKSPTILEKDQVPASLL